MGVVNFAHGAFYTLGAFSRSPLAAVVRSHYWAALVLAQLGGRPASVSSWKRLLLRRLYRLDPLYGLLMTFGLALIVEGSLHQVFGSSGQSYPVPAALAGAIDLGFMILPLYRAWVIIASLVVCFGTWFVIERTRLGATLRAATETAPLLQAFGVNVPLLNGRDLRRRRGAGCARGRAGGPGRAGELPQGTSLVIVVFAVVVIGEWDRSSAPSSAASPWAWSRASRKSSTPEASNIVRLHHHGLVLILRPAGLFGKE